MVRKETVQAYLCLHASCQAIAIQGSYTDAISTWSPTVCVSREATPILSKSLYPRPGLGAHMHACVHVYARMAGC